jgi:hypothetical protein
VPVLRALVAVVSTAHKALRRAHDLVYHPPGPRVPNRLRGVHEPAEAVVRGRPAQGGAVRVTRRVVGRGRRQWQVLAVVVERPLHGRIHRSPAGPGGRGRGRGRVARVARRLPGRCERRRRRAPAGARRALRSAHSRARCGANDARPRRLGGNRTSRRTCRWMWRSITPERRVRSRRRRRLAPLPRSISSAPFPPCAHRTSLNSSSKYHARTWLSSLIPQLIGPRSQPPSPRVEATVHSPLN